jgi:hypothetical protein
VMLGGGGSRNREALAEERSLCWRLLGSDPVQRETKLAISEGKITAQRKFVDWSERREMAELVLRLKGYLVNKHHVDTGPTLEELIAGSMR